MTSEIFLTTVYIMKMSAVINHIDNNFGEIFDYGSPLQWSMNLFSFNLNTDRFENRLQLKTAKRFLNQK
jgi:hypothetical protein